MKTEADDFRNQHGRRLAEHGGFRFDAADAPAENAEGVDHGGVRIGADDGIGVSLHAASGRHGADYTGEIFEIYLVADAGVRRNDFEIFEGGLAPAEKGVALDIALKLQLGVETESIGVAEFIDLHGMVDDQLGGEEWIDARGIAAHALDGFAHGGEINHGGNAGEVLQQNACGHEGDFFLYSVGSPTGERANVFGANEAAIFAAQKIFQQDAKGKRQLRERVDAC